MLRIQTLYWIYMRQEKSCLHTWENRILKFRKPFRVKGICLLMDKISGLRLFLTFESLLHYRSYSLFAKQSRYLLLDYPASILPWWGSSTLFFILELSLSLLVLMVWVDLTLLSDTSPRPGQRAPKIKSDIHTGRQAGTHQRKQICWDELFTPEVISIL